MKTHDIKKIKVRTITRSLVEQAPRIHSPKSKFCETSGYPWDKVKILGDLNDGFLLVKNGCQLERVSVTVYVTDFAIKYGWGKGGEEGKAAFQRAYDEGNHGFKQVFTI